MAVKQAETPLPTSRLTLRVIALVLVAMGIIVSGYLSYVKLTNVPMACAKDAGFDCEAVQNSPYAYLLGIPVAWLGLGTYFVIGGMILLEDRLTFMQDWGIPLTFGLVLFAFMFSMYLVYIQGVRIQAWCMWCLMHEAIMTVLIIVYGFRLRNFLTQPSLT